MFYFVHVLAGAAIAKFFPNLLLIIILNLLFHFLLDAIPHRDSLFTKEVYKKSYKIRITEKAVLFETANMLIALLLISWLYIKFKSILILFSIFISLLPDIARIFYLTKLRENKIFKKYIFFHSKIQKEVSWKLGILTQLIITIILLKILF